MIQHKNPVQSVKDYLTNMDVNKEQNLAISAYFLRRDFYQRKITTENTQVEIIKSSDPV